MRSGGDALDEVHERLDFGGGFDPVAVKQLRHGVEGVVEIGIIFVATREVAGFDGRSGEHAGVFGVGQNRRVDHFVIGIVGFGGFGADDGLGVDAEAEALAEEEAGGQYNVDPFRVQTHETLKPNPSFDLVRLSTAMFWDIFPEGPSHEEYKDNPLFKTLLRWLTLDDGKSILFGKSESKHDRYHGFNLYKAIARYCKDSAVPRKEIQNLIPVFGITGSPPIEMDIVI